MSFRARRIRRGRDGRYQVKLPGEERQLLRSLPGQVTELLAGGDPLTTRLFPPAYGGDHDGFEAEYQRFMRSDLEASHRRALDTLAETAEAEDLSEEEMGAWMAALNSIRLVLGTRLDISEEMAAEPVDEDDPNAALLSLYHYLSWLQEMVVEAMAR